jgi:hypothetical protein
LEDTYKSVSEGTESDELERVADALPQTVEEMINEVSLSSTGVKNFLRALYRNTNIIKKLGFSNFKGVIDYIQSNGIRDWDDLRDDATKFGLKFEYVTEVGDVIDTITMDIPLFIRTLEFAREDAKTDMDLHDFAERAIKLTKEKGTIDMSSYNELIGGSSVNEGAGCGCGCGCGGSKLTENTEPTIITQLKDIVKTSSNKVLVDPKSGKKVRVDLYSASAITKVYDALKQQSNKDKFVSTGLMGMQSMAFKLLK